MDLIYYLQGARHMRGKSRDGGIDLGHDVMQNKLLTVFYGFFRMWIKYPVTFLIVFKHGYCRQNLCNPRGT